MQGLVTLDFGNSRPHAGLFLKAQGNWELVKVVKWNELSMYLPQLGMNPDNSQIVLCEVRAREDELLPFLKQGFLLTRIQEYWRGERFAGMPVNYAKTLGEDRLITAHYTYKHDKTSTLVVDAGTFVTLDVVSSNGFEGGYIIPGTHTYYSSFTAGEQLAAVSTEGELSTELPHATTAAMRDGYTAFGALAAELVKSRNLKRIIITGGDHALWEKLLAPLNIPMTTDPYYIHRAMRHWMCTQIEPL